VLSLRHNRLTEISRLVANALVDSCPLLAEFDLSFNRLRALPPALGRLAKLRWLSVRNNALVSLPAFAAAPLEFLDISKNEFATWPLTLDESALRHCRELLRRRQSARASCRSLMLGALPELRACRCAATRWHACPTA
jgi:hypothetical protein